MVIAQRLLGAWTLVNQVERPVDGGTPRHPLGARPSGSILYTPDGYMSAQLAQPVTDPASTAADGYYIAYSGPFDVDEQARTVRHQLDVSVIPALVGTELVRRVTFTDDDGTLILDALEPSDRGGVRTLVSITWARLPHRSP